MEKQDLRIVYMGTPDFAVAPLKALIENGYNVVGVVTMPDKPMGRHQSTLRSSAVGQYAKELGLPLLQPERLKDPEFLKQLQDLRPQLQIVVAFRMLPEVVWALPPLGTFNLHASLLPQYRGAAPINWAIINGEQQSGVTTFFLQHDIDTGDIIEQAALPIGPDEDAGSLHDRLQQLGAQLVVSTTQLILEGRATTHPQPSAGATLQPAPKIFKDTCRINWHDNSAHVHNLVRGLSPHPGAWTTLRQASADAGTAREIKIFKTSLASAPADAPSSPSCGQLHVAHKKQLYVACQDGWVEILQLQPSGKRRMDASDYLRGLQHPETWIME